MAWTDAPQPYTILCRYADVINPKEEKMLFMMPNSLGVTGTDEIFLLGCVNYLFKPK